jgi:hypothetical protein
MHYETDLSKEDVLNQISKMVSPPDWHLAIDKAVNNRILEGTVTDDSFMVVKGRYALTFGRTSLLPIMKGHVQFDPQKRKTMIKIVIRPYKAGLFGLAPFYCIAIYAFVQSCQQGMFMQAFMSSLFLVVIYGSILTKYNRELKNYVEILESNLLANRTR